MSNQVIKIEAPELSLIEESKAAKIKATFEPMVEMLEGFEQTFNEIITEAKTEITTDVTAKAKRLRLDIGKVRIQTGKLKDQEKEEYKRAANAIQGVHNIIVWAVTEKEDKLKEIEKHFEIIEQKRLEALQSERVELLSPFVEDAELRDLSSMDSDVWDAYFSAKKKEYQDRIEAEKAAEKARIEAEKAAIEERKRIEAENARLKAEAEERERLAKIEAEKKAKEEAARLAKEKAEREEREAELQAEREERARIEKEEREKREKLEAELKAKEEAEIAAKKAEESRKQAELSKGDADKVKDLISDLEALKTKYTFDSLKNQTMYSTVSQLLDKVINHIK